MTIESEKWQKAFDERYDYCVTFMSGEEASCEAAEYADKHYKPQYRNRFDCIMDDGWSDEC